jgi:hypothetical protein
VPRLVLAFVALFFVSCSYASLTGFQLPEEDQAGKRFYVIHQPNDNRRIDHILAQALLTRGFDVASDLSESPDYVVTYIDKWAWDMRTYLVDFRLDIRDAETNLLVGTGRSFQTSLDAMGHTYGEIAKSALDAALKGKQRHVNR